MKNKLFIGLMVILASFFALQAFDKGGEKGEASLLKIENHIAEKMAHNAEILGSTSTYRYAWAADTITNAERDTLAVPVNLLTNFQVQIQCVRTSLSGTHNVKIILDESNLTTGITDWRAIDSTSTTSATITAIRQASTYGVRYRVRVVGTGTQSSRYVANIVAKPLI